MIDYLTNKKMKLDLNDLSKLKNAFKNNFDAIENVKSILLNFPFLLDDIENRIKDGVLFQPGRIVESIIIQLIANNLNCSYYGNGVYENEQYRLFQDGGSSKNDLTIYDKFDNILKVFEIKEPFAYGKTCGFTYDNNGKPVDFTSKNDDFREYIKSLFDGDGKLSKYNILKNQGRNEYFNTCDVFTNDFDYLITYDEYGNLIFMTKDEYKTKVNFRYEVRSCGRNCRNVFTPSKLNLLDNVLCFEINDVINITQRGGKTSRRYKYISGGATFSFLKKDVKHIDGHFCVELKKIKQHLGEVSIQHCIK